MHDFLNPVFDNTCGYLISSCLLPHLVSYEPTVREGEQRKDRAS